MSFVLLNVPDNETLNASYYDSDNDFLSDWEELYQTYTNPFEEDTDNDGIIDYTEINTGTDPNDYFNHSHDNFPPDIPTIQGPINGQVGNSYDYSFFTIDPNLDQVEYYIEWGDGEYEDWFGPFDTGVPQIKSHTWQTKGTLTIRCKARDVDGFESDLGYLQVNIQKSKTYHNSFLLRLFERFPNAFPILRFILRL